MPAPASAGRRWTGLLLPSLSDCLFVFLLVWLFLAQGVGEAGWDRLLMDGDTGWHIRVGESILETGSVPRTDPFSFSKPGQPWFAWEWLTDVLYGWLHLNWGLKGIVLLAALQIGLFALLLFRYTLWRGANAWVALAVTLLGVGASSVHYLARPHLFTMLLLVVSLWLLESDRRAPGARVWLLVPLTALWTNLHGGFLALIACLALLVAGSGVETLLNARPWSGRWAPVGRYALLTAACALASLANPYGIQLHRHIAAYLRSDWIRDMVQEFQSPSFRSENLLHFEILLLAAVLAAGELLRRKRVTEALWIFAWAHLTLGAVRHVPVFVAVAAPLVASEATALWNLLIRDRSPRSTLRILDQVAADLRPGFRRTSLWLAGFVVLLAASGPWLGWPRDFPEKKFPIRLIHLHAGRFPHARLLSEDQWADYLLYRFHPSQKVFFDGRSDFYGPEIGNQYVRLMQGQHDWRQILDAHRIDLVLSPAAWPLASLLKQGASWRLLADDGRALLFERRPQTSLPQANKRLRSFPQGPPQKSTLGLMKQTPPAESTKGDHSE